VPCRMVAGFRCRRAKLLPREVRVALHRRFRLPRAEVLQFRQRGAGDSDARAQRARPATEQDDKRGSTGAPWHLDSVRNLERPAKAATVDAGSVWGCRALTPTKCQETDATDKGEPLPAMSATGRCAIDPRRVDLIICQGETTIRFDVWVPEPAAVLSHR
jgi:hypothetical protein